MEKAEESKEKKETVEEVKQQQSANPELEKANAEITALKAENAAAMAKIDVLFRQCAELDNMRKRTVRDRDDEIARAKADMVKAILPTLDDFQRALASAETGNECAKMVEGVKMIQTNLYMMLQKNYGLEEMHPEGKPYDPHQQEVFMMVEDENLKEETVLESLIAGYTVGGKVLRPAKVKIGKPKAKN